MKAGEVVRVRPKRVPGAPVTVTVAATLEKHYANGYGFVGDDGVSYGHWFYDLDLRLNSLG